MLKQELLKLKKNIYFFISNFKYKRDCVDTYLKTDFLLQYRVVNKYQTYNSEKCRPN